MLGLPRRLILPLILIAAIPAVGGGLVDHSAGLGVLYFVAIVVGGWGFAWTLSLVGRNRSR
jgi:hypothetical protein